jgi:hypothetical protein
MNDFHDAYSDQTELQLAIMNIEESRLRLIQEVFNSLGGVKVVIKLLSITPASLRKTLNNNSIRLLQRMAINFGIAINDTGNPVIQVKLNRYPLIYNYN